MEHFGLLITLAMVMIILAAFVGVSWYDQVKLPVTFSCADPQAFHDEGRAEFLLALDSSSAKLDKWEKDFVYSNVGKKVFSPAQRTQIDRLAIKYAYVY